MSPAITLFLELVAVYILMTWALYLPFKAGQLFNGPVYTMAVGGYTAAYCVQSLGWPLPAALALAVVLAAFFGFIPALGFARTRGIATAMGSIALIFIVQSVLMNLDFLGGPAGIKRLPRLSYLLPMAYGFVVVIGVLLSRLERSRMGRAMEAIAADADFAGTMGVSVSWVNVAALTVASAIGGIAGVIYTFVIRSIQPTTFGFTLLLYVWAMLFVGGRYTMWGAVVAAPLLWGLPQLLPGQATSYTRIILGCLLAIVIVAAPNGIISRDLVNRVSSVLSRAPHDGDQTRARATLTQREEEGEDV